MIGNIAPMDDGAYRPSPPHQNHHIPQRRIAGNTAQIQRQLQRILGRVRRRVLQLGLEGAARRQRDLVGRLVLVVAGLGLGGRAAGDAG